MPKIMIVYADSGAGHRRAAEALARLVPEVFPGSEAALFDVLDFASPLFKRSYPGTYLFLVKHCPWLWGLSYYLMNTPLVDRVGRLFRRATNAKHCREFERHLLAERPDLVITTHFLPNEIISHLKRKHGFRTFLATCVTDYHAHRILRDHGVDLYFVPNADLIPNLQRMGIPARRIRPLGLPVMPFFERLGDQAASRAKLGLADQFTVIVASGGFGVGPITELLAELEQINRPIQVVAICGKNPALREELLQLTRDSKHRYQIHGFVDNMHEFMAAGDVMISKSGGLTTTEAMAAGLPLLIFCPIPGQEANNRDFVVSHGAGLPVRDARDARRALEELLADPGRLRRLREHMKALGRPRAAREILTELKGIVSKSS